MGKGGAQLRDDFIVSTKVEPHILRRKEILAKHPEIEQLFGPDIRPFPVVVFMIVSQIYIAYLAQNWSWPFIVFVAYFYGGTVTHSLALMTHELSHNLMFKTAILNDYFGILCNTAMGAPASSLFKRYHMEHHQFQGSIDKDTDVPVAFEGRLFRGVFLKALWMFLQPLAYTFRPMLTAPKTPKKMDIINWVVVMGCNALFLHFWGVKSLCYPLISTFLGFGLHPMAGHLVAEHFVFTPGYETYSYYGPLNYLAWNVGYHNEHHDFPRVPGWKLPLVKKIAPEFYDDLPSHASWPGVIYRFITDENICCFDRVVRDRKNIKRA